LLIFQFEEQIRHDSGPEHCALFGDLDPEMKHGLTEYSSIVGLHD
jgi:hypothetical protein